MSATKTRRLTSSAKRFIEHEDKREWLAKASDVQLLQMTYALVCEIDDDEQGKGETLKDSFYFVLREAFERFAPEAEWASEVRDMPEDADLRAEMESVLESMIKRAAERMRTRLVIPNEQGTS